jgi:RNA recognition motif-containing protein
MSKRLYVGNLSHSTNEDDLTAAFETAGHPVSHVRLVLDRETIRPGAFAIVEVPTEEGASRAIAALNGRQLLGRHVVVSQVHPHKAGRTNCSLPADENDYR